MTVLLAELLDVVRSKNAGPYELTFDLIFRRAADYRRIKAGGLIDEALVAGLYRLERRDVLGIHYYDPASAVKVTIRRSRAAGDPGETDVYGAQQHAPWLTLEIP
ncbi:MAG: DUF4387 domain-containing protein [Patescibacteria group bacterium]